MPASSATAAPAIATTLAGSCASKELAPYVETSDRSTEEFYRRLGFTVVAPRLAHLPDGPPYTGLRREVR